MSDTIIAGNGGPGHRRRAWAVLLPLLALPAGARAAGPSQLYEVHDTGLLCGLPPCFSYCAHDVATGEDRRFSRLALPAGQERLLEDARPAIVEGSFQEVDGHARPGLELRVSRIVGRAVEPAPRGRCPLLTRPAP